MIVNALYDRPLPVYGDGLNVRDWIHVSDHCRALDLILHRGQVGEVYNIGAHSEVSNIDIVRLILGELKKPESLIRHVEDRKGHDRRYALDASKLQNQLGWRPEVEFEKGIGETIGWYLDNRGWWESMISGEDREYYDRMYGSKLGEKPQAAD